MPIVLCLEVRIMPKSPFLKKNQPEKSITETNRRKQKFAIWDHYKRESTKTPPKNQKPTKK
jgi:hypothetical protein